MARPVNPPPSTLPKGQCLCGMTPHHPWVPRQSMSAWYRSITWIVLAVPTEVQPAPEWCLALVHSSPGADVGQRMSLCVHPVLPMPISPGASQHAQAGCPPPAPASSSTPSSPEPFLSWAMAPVTLPSPVPQQHRSRSLQPPLSPSIGRAPVGDCAVGWAGSQACGSGPCSGTPSRPGTPTTSARGSGMSGWPAGRER